MEGRWSVSPLRRRAPVGLFSIGWFGLESVPLGGHAGLRGWSRHAMALVAGVALALSVGAATAPPASAWSELTNCTITVYNNTNYTMQLYNSVGYGSVISPEDPNSHGLREAPFAPNSISPMGS